VFDVAVASNGLALLTTLGWARVREINLATNAITVRNDLPYPGDITDSTQIHRSNDGTRFYFLAGNSSNASIFTYSAATNTFGASADTYAFLRAAGVNRNGTLLGTVMFNNGASLDTAANFNHVYSFSAGDSGVAFDTHMDIFYTINGSISQIIAHNTNTHSEIFRLDIGESMGPFFIQFGEGTLVASPDGVHLALATPSGVRIYDVTTGTPPPPATFGTPRDMVFDHAGQRLYITTREGLVWPYNLATNTFGTPYDLGGSLKGLDITADDALLLVAQGNRGLTQSAFQKLDLASGVVTNATYTHGSFGEAGAWDVAIASNGLAFGTTTIDGSGWNPLRQIDLSTNAVTDRTDATGSGFNGKIKEFTQIHRSADRTRLYFLEADSSDGPRFTYSGVSDTFGPSSHTDTDLGNASAAVNRNGTLLATTIGSTSLATAPGFNFVHTFDRLNNGVAFDAIQDTIYGVNRANDQIVAYDTNTFGEKFRFDVGEDVSSTAIVFGPGTLVASQDGHYLAMITPTTIRVFHVPAVFLASVTSTKTHGSAGTFDVNLPLDGSSGIECRSGGINGQYAMIFTFGTNLANVGGASVSDGIGMMGSHTIDAGNTHRYIVNLTNVTNAQYIKVTLNNVNDIAGAHTEEISARMGVLVGDTNSSHTVNSTDVSQTKAQSGQAVTNSNFREDLLANGSINATDISLAKSKSGQGLLP
jgi:hypothetical protein